MIKKTHILMVGVLVSLVFGLTSSTYVAARVVGPHGETGSSAPSKTPPPPQYVYSWISAPDGGAETMNTSGTYPSSAECEKARAEFNGSDNASYGEAYPCRVSTQPAPPLSSADPKNPVTTPPPDPTPAFDPATNPDPVTPQGVVPFNPAPPPDPLVTQPPQGNPAPLAGVPANNPNFGSPVKKEYSTLCSLVNAIINVIAEIGGIAAVLFIIWSGFLFIKAQGNQAKLGEAKRVLFTTIAGAAILLGATVITKIVFNTISIIAKDTKSLSLCAPGSTPSSSSSPTPSPSVPPAPTPSPTTPTTPLPAI